MTAVPAQEFRHGLQGRLPKRSKSRAHILRLGPSHLPVWHQYPTKKNAGERPCTLSAALIAPMALLALSWFVLTPPRAPRRTAPAFLQKIGIRSVIYLCQEEYSRQVPPPVRDISWLL